MIAHNTQYIDDSFQLPMQVHDISEFEKKAKTWQSYVSIDIA